MLAAGFAARRSSLLRPPPTPSRPPQPFPGSAGYGRGIASRSAVVESAVLSSARRPGHPWSTGHPPWGSSPPHVGSAGLLVCRRRPPRGRGGPLQFPGQPSGRSTPTTPESSWAPAPGSGVLSVAFALFPWARLSLGPLVAGGADDACRASLPLQTGPVARPLPGTSSLRFDGGVSPDAGSRATGDPGVSPDQTHAGGLP